MQHAHRSQYAIGTRENPVILVANQYIYSTTWLRENDPIPSGYALVMTARADANQHGMNAQQVYDKYVELGLPVAWASVRSQLPHNNQTFAKQVYRELDLAIAVEPGWYDEIDGELFYIDLEINSYRAPVFVDAISFIKCSNQARDSHYS